MRSVELIRLQLDEAYRFVREAVDGLTDEELLWEPVPGCWSIRPNRGENPPEFLRATPNRRPWYIEEGWNGTAFDTPDPPPLTTIGWLLVHVASCKVMYDEVAFEPEPAELTFDDLVVATAAEAVALLEEGQDRLVRRLAALSDEDLGETRTYEDEPVVAWRLFWRLIQHDLTHGAEIARMRALHRALGHRDA